MNSNRTALVGVMLFVSALVFSGCSETGAGTPVVPTDKPNSESASVPEVAAPLDASRYLGNPCDLVPQNSMADLGYSEPGEKRTKETTATSIMAGPGCAWVVLDGIKSVAVFVHADNQSRGAGGLAALHENYKLGRFAYWEPETVDGYPAAFSDVSDQRDRGGCGLAVGIANDLSFSVSVQGYTKQPDQACADAKQVAEQVISTLKGGS
ncbi:DUF3558 domain-containing protein [Amycolatopsis palatopharyngis]|uniref:DUF3558 domain-containing protein n=1 Tax=Amycolatopsis palatopharyngis TaxID=187982 RepID=UPI000E23926E|nr:DUF3558 domain-containing protein [Amycolatopsis palatopharyngis]